MSSIHICIHMYIHICVCLNTHIRKMLAQSILLPYTCVHVCVCVWMCDMHVVFSWHISIWDTQSDGIVLWSLGRSSVEITHCFSDTFVCGLSTVCDVRRNVCGASIVVAALLLKQPCSNGPNVDTHVYECDPCKNALVSTFYTCVVHTCPCTTGAHVCLMGSASSCCSLSLYLSLSHTYPVSLPYHPFSIALSVTGKPCYECALLWSRTDTPPQ